MITYLYVINTPIEDEVTVASADFLDFDIFHCGVSNRRVFL